MTSKYDLTPTEFVEAGRIRFAFRRLGKESAVPLVLLVHYRGSMDNWDPKLVDALAKERTVIAFDNRGVSSTSGSTPNTYREMADDAARFVQALGYEKVDVLGFSIGGHIAEATLSSWGVLHKAGLASTMPQGSKGLINSRPEVIAVATKPVVELTDFLTLFFEQSPTSQKLGRSYIERRQNRTLDVEPATRCANGRSARKSSKKRGQKWIRLKGWRIFSASCIPYLSRTVATM